VLLQRLGNRGIRLGTLFERAAARHPGSTLVLDHDLDVAPGFGRRATYSQVADLVGDLASRLSAVGVRPAQHVVVYKSHGFDITLLACAIAHVGAVPMLLSPMLDGETVAALILRTDRPFLITDQAKLENELPSCVTALTQRVLLASGSYEGAIELQRLSGVPRTAPFTTPPDHPALITHTSGTTGTPKLAVHTGFTFQARYRPQATMARLFLPGKQTVAIHVSFVHSRLVTALAIPLLRGWPIIIMADDAPGKAADLLAREHPTVIEAHPNTFMAWEELADDPRQPLAHMKVFSSTFDALHPKTVARLLSASRRRRPMFAQIYGQSEIGPTIFRGYGRKRDPEADLRCVGIPYPGMTSARVVSRNGKRPSKENPGLIEIRSDGRVVTYLGEDERYQKQFSDGGWWRMGDLGYRTKMGCIHLVDREVDYIEGFGSTLAAEDILFTRIPQLSEVAIVPGPDGMAVPVVCTKGDQPLNIGAWESATADLPGLTHPVHWRNDELPKTATVKVRRLELARQLAANDAGSPSHGRIR
jgi:acyl-coenzyme A synthetase/AMP-(fatty) acid ligase